MDDVEAGIDSGSGAGADTGVDSSSSAGGDKDNTDWKALYEKADSEKENYKKALSQKREFVKAGIVEDKGEEAEEKLTATVRKVIQEEIIPVVAQNKLEQELEKQVSDPEKRKFVKLLYETRVRQMGTSDDAIREGISDALAIADKQKLSKAAAEVNRKQNMQSSPALSGSSSEGAPVSKNHKFSDQQVASLTQRAKALGMDPKQFIEQTWRNQVRG